MQLIWYKFQARILIYSIFSFSLSLVLSHSLPLYVCISFYPSDRSKYVTTKENAMERVVHKRSVRVSFIVQMAFPTSPFAFLSTVIKWLCWWYRYKTKALQLWEGWGCQCRWIRNVPPMISIVKVNKKIVRLMPWRWRDMQNTKVRYASASILCIRRWNFIEMIWKRQKTTNNKQIQKRLKTG